MGEPVLLEPDFIDDLLGKQIDVDNEQYATELERLRARVAELEQENARLQASLDDCESFSSPNWNNVD